MATMQAFQLTGWQQPPVYRDVPVPTPGPGEVLIKMAAVGLCHSDFLFMQSPEGTLPYTLPFTLGHENAGYVATLGEGVIGLHPGQPVAVAGINGCGHCRYCRTGNDNYCLSGWKGRGYGEDGGLAEYLLAPARQVVPIGSLSPRQAAPLTDAGSTSYHAVKKVLPKLVPGSTAVVIGVGGLGSYAVQYLRQLSGARIIAVDNVPERLEVASRLGAHETLLSTPDLLNDLRRFGMADGVFDFVGNDETITAGIGIAGPLASVALVGAGGGTAQVKWGGIALEVDVFIPQGASVQDLHDVVALAQTGRLQIDTVEYAFADAAEAYRAFDAGELNARAVIVLE